MKTMEFLNSYKLYWLRAFKYSGRASRGQYFAPWIINIVILLPFILNLDTPVSTFSSVMTTYMYAATGWLLINILPSLSLTVRRFHDQDKSGWYILLNFIPFIGGLIVLYFCLFVDGDYEENQYGTIISD